MNNVFLLGRLTADPEIKKTTTGKSVANFTLAVNRRGQSKETDFINCTAWEKTADLLSNYFTKGKPIIVEGAIQTRSYEDKNGNKRTATDVVVRNIEFVLSDKTLAEQPKEEDAFTEVDDLPFDFN